MMLDIVNVDCKFFGGEVVFVVEVMKFWGIDFYEVFDCLIFLICWWV